MPAAPEQTTGEGVPSIFYEDRNLMTVRMKRVTHPHAWSQSPMWGTSEAPMRNQFRAWTRYVAGGR